MTLANLDQPVRDALSRGGIIDITTTGRKSGQPRRLEIVFHNIDGRLYVSGMLGSSGTTLPTSRPIRTSPST